MTHPLHSTGYWETSLVSAKFDELLFILLWNVVFSHIKSSYKALTFPIPTHQNTYHKTDAPKMNQVWMHTWATRFQFQQNCTGIPNTTIQLSWSRKSSLLSCSKENLGEVISLLYFPKFWNYTVFCPGQSKGEDLKIHSIYNSCSAPGIILSYGMTAEQKCPACRVVLTVSVSYIE